ncbi:RING domain ligase2 [Actinidia rufa]|uniref:RING domain ligase2 n=1 Tax=Actinidia rufa TaxID=165716 RepID=A0A7J0EAY9_9ERIC|nr:RING domain ligase2 [Actinidia rufa]
MGGKFSREGSWRQSSSVQSASSSWSQYEYPQSTHTQESQIYAPQVAYPAYPPQRNLDRRYSRIADDFNSLEGVTDALRRAGLESSNLIVGIDFTKSNEWTGARSFNRRSLHHIGNALNPYEQAISIIGKTLAAFDEDNLIPCYGFGDASTHDQDVFSFYPDERSCNGFEEVLSQYREIVPHLCLAGPTSFAPVIEMAMTIVEQSGGQYHVLLIIADGQVTRSVDTEHSQLSPQERKTVEAIVQASRRKGNVPERVPLPPPITGAASFSSRKFSHSTRFQQSSSPYHRHSSPAGTAPSASSSTLDNQLCPICISNSKDMAFGCGHQVNTFIDPI